jgi:hypothetical protein
MHIKNDATILRGLIFCSNISVKQRPELCPRWSMIYTNPAIFLEAVIISLTGISFTR